MPTAFYPLLTVENYGAFKALIVDLPDIYDQWKFETDRDKAKQNLEWTTGFEGKDVPVDSVAFRANGKTPTRSVLERYDEVYWRRQQLITHHHHHADRAATISIDNPPSATTTKNYPGTRDRIAS